MGIIIAISRYVLPFLTVVILTKCMLSLLLGHPKEKIYGYITDMTDGKSYPLNMWETSIGRSNSCDIVIGYDTVSRFQAVISRRIDGWYIYDLLSKSGILVNGEKIDKKDTIKNGDILTFGIIQYRFVVTDDPVARVGKKRGKQRGAQSQQERPYRPEQNSANPYAQYTRGPQSASFYGSNNKPNLDFESRSEQYGFPSQSEKSAGIFSGKDYVNVETPGRTQEQNYTYTGKSPAVVNMDTGETYILCGNLVTVGRSHSNDIKLTSPTVSRHHAKFVLYEDGWAIVDAGSSAGTMLNGNRIKEPQLLFDSDVIAISDERLLYTAGASRKSN